MKMHYFPVFLLATVVTACTVPREGRTLKKLTKDWRKSPVFFEGYQEDSPFGSTALTLYDNKKFSFTSNFSFLTSYAAGS